MELPALLDRSDLLKGTIFSCTDFVERVGFHCMKAIDEEKRGK